MPFAAVVPTPSLFGDNFRTSSVRDIVVDASGKIAAKFEGITSVAEVEPALQSVLQGQPSR